MKKWTGLIALIISGILVEAQVPTYYNDVNLTLTGMALKAELAQKIINTHTTQLQYNDLWTVLQQTDLDPANSNKVLLIYGYNDGDNNVVTDRTRIKTNYGGNNGQWNREHVYAKSLGTPDLGTVGPGADAHHIRCSDVQMNNNRGSKKFATGSGNAGTVGSNWYPGNEWKGDVARMMMYMYLRYSSQCLPSNVGVGSSVSIDPSMITLFLQWNAEDDVSTYETNRNNILETEQGNRNPFIDNPYLATVIWGGTVANDHWNMTSTFDVKDSDSFFKVYPVPSYNGDLTIYLDESAEAENVELFNLSGEKILTLEADVFQNGQYTLKEIPKGFYLLKTLLNGEPITRKVIVN
ncbi:MAG: endonuclease [Flavobacteriales bacterium]|nr:endonuclease [Flavobacteriales bacterium]